MCGSNWPVVAAALCPGGGCVCAGMGADPGCAAGAGDAEAVSESVVEVSEDVDVMDVSGLSDALGALLCGACGRCGSAPVCGASAGGRQWLAREAAVAASRSPRKVWSKVS